MEQLMKVNKNLLATMHARSGVTPEQNEAVWNLLVESQSDVASFKMAHILYYLGGMLAIGALSLFMTLGFEIFGGLGIFFIALLYGGGGLWGVERLVKRKGMMVPSGIIATFALTMVPLALFGLLSAIGFMNTTDYRSYHQVVSFKFVGMELCTLIAALLMLRRYQFPFLMMPVAVTLWYMTMDVHAELSKLLGVSSVNLFDHFASVSSILSLVFFMVAIRVDIKMGNRKDGTSKDYAFWLYLFSLITIYSSGIYKMIDGTGLVLPLSIVFNMVVLSIGAALSRRMFVVFGGLGLTGNAFHLASYFSESALFPFVLIGIGFGIIYLGSVWQKNELKIKKSLQKFFPKSFQEMMQARKE